MYVGEKLQLSFTYQLKDDSGMIYRWWSFRVRMLDVLPSIKFRASLSPLALVNEN